jgi:hypothetical protein
LTYEEIEQVSTRIYATVKNIPGVDQNFIRKCLQGISALADPEVDQKIKNLARFL